MVIVGEVWLFIELKTLYIIMPNVVFTMSVTFERLFLNVYIYHQTYRHNKTETRRVKTLIILFSDKVRIRAKYVRTPHNLVTSRRDS